MTTKRSLFKAIKTIVIGVLLAIGLFFGTAPLLQNTTIPTGAILPIGWSVERCGGDGGPFENAGWPFLNTRYSSCGSGQVNGLALIIDVAVMVGMYLLPAMLILWLARLGLRKIARHD